MVQYSHSCAINSQGLYRGNEGGCIHWPSDMSALQRPSIWSHCQWWRECSLECLLTCCDWFSRKCKSHHLLEACGGSYNFLQEAWLQLVTQDAFPTFTLGFLSDKLWCCKWQTRWMFSPGHLSDGGHIHGQMGCCHISRLLLDNEEWCSRYLAQVTSKKAPCLIHASLPLSPASVQHYNQNFWNYSQSRDLNSNLMFCIANSTK